jgi:2'-hydroxyisoflavone reductase
MLAPGDGSDYVQLVDARDVARFTQRAIEKHTPASSTWPDRGSTWAAFMDALGVANPVWVPSTLIDQAGLNLHGASLISLEWIHERESHARQP